MYSTFIEKQKKKVFIGEGTVNSNDAKWDGNYYSEGYRKIVFSVSHPYWSLNIFQLK